MSETVRNPGLDELHRLAVRNFNHFRRVSWAIGGVCAVVAITMYAVDLVGNGPIHPNLSLYGIIRYMTFYWAFWFLLNATLRIRLLPIIRPPQTAAEHKIYRNWLYSHARPISEIWRDISTGILFFLPFLIIIGLYIYIYFEWPEYRTSGLVVGAVLVIGAMVAMVHFYIEPERIKRESWIAAHFPASSEGE